MNRCYRKTAFFILIGISLISLSACLGNRNWEYPPQPNKSYLESKASHSLPLRVVVLPFEDLRGNSVQDEYWKIAIPLVPSGETIYDRPETVEDPEPVDLVRFDPPTDFAKATTAELREAQLFSSVVFGKNEEMPPADLVFRGRLQSTQWKRWITTYGLGPFGVIPWMLGAPMGETTTTVEMDLQLTPVNDPSKVLWSMVMQFEGKETDGPYYGLENAVESYPDALQEALRPAIIDLVQLVETSPERLQPES